MPMSVSSCRLSLYEKQSERVSSKLLYGMMIVLAKNEKDNMTAKSFFKTGKLRIIGEYRLMNAANFRVSLMLNPSHVRSS